MGPALPRGTTVNRKTELASSRWATDQELADAPGIALAKSPEALAKEGALYLGKVPAGRYAGYIDDRHCLTVAGSRAGKGTGLIVPNLALYPGSVLCIDPKGENARLTAQRRREMGQDVYVLDPFDAAGSGESGVYNPLDDLDPARASFIDDAALIADSLITDSEARDPHWNEAARELIKGLILHVVLDQPFDDQKTLVTVRHILRDRTRLNGALGEMMVPEATDEAHGVAAAAASSFTSKPDREADSVLSTALRHTEFLDSPGMARVLGGGLTPPGTTLHELASLRRLRAAYRSGDRPGVTVYLCLPATRMATHARWLRLVVSMALALFEQDAQESPAGPGGKKETGPPVLFLLDEFASLGHMPALAAAAGLMAGYGLKLWPFLQDLSQLKAHYRDSWETFIGNAGLHLFFGNTDTTTLKHVSERLGNVRVAATGLSVQSRPGYQGGDQPSYSVSDTATPLLSPDEVQRTFARNAGGGTWMAALLPGLHPAILQKTDWFADPALTKLVAGRPARGGWLRGRL